MSLMECLFSNEHITNKTLMVWGVIFILLYIACFNNHEYLVYCRNKVHKFCMYKCETQECSDFQKSVKGGSYYTTDIEENESIEYCPLGFWELSHFITHIFIGYYLNMSYSLGIGFGFEVYEYFVYDCASYPDLIANTLGGLLGSYLRCRAVV